MRGSKVAQVIIAWEFALLGLVYFLHTARIQARADYGTSLEMFLTVGLGLVSFALQYWIVKGLAVLLIGWLARSIHELLRIVWEYDWNDRIGPWKITSITATRDGARYFQVNGCWHYHLLNDAIGFAYRPNLESPPWGKRWLDLEPMADGWYYFEVTWEP